MAPSQPPIEPATERDVDRITDLFVADMRDLGTRPERAAMREVVVRMLADPGTILRVIRVDGRVAGVLAANEFLSLKYPGRALWIEEVYVDPEFRRRGLARTMVDQFLDWAWDQGYAGVDLEAYRMNTAASILYRSVGFRRLARERYSFDMAEFEPEPDDA